ncbi:MAG TPA: thiopeptide maturation pyridine synthase [Streptosporangiaceae bacterium]|nr:thiopeptide maturation pyridine synthase [Streptosporangiaceae bacterium]
MSWHSLHIHYHGDQDRLIVGVVKPLATQWAQGLPGGNGTPVRSYFQRHWRQGPHVRINVEADPAAYSQAIRPAVVARAAEFMAACPSTAPADEERLTPVHQRLAMEERERGPLSPWVPDNTVTDAGYDDRRHVLGTEQACRLFADFNVMTTDLALRMTEDAVHTGDRLSSCLDLMVATAQEFAPRGIAQGAMSMRSHAEWFLVRSGAAGSLRPRWDDRYRRCAGEVREQVSHVLGATDAGMAAPHVRRWLETMRVIHQRAGELADCGLLPLPGVERDPYKPFNSPFHLALDRNDVWLSEVRDARWFQQYRLMLNYLYVHFTRLGVRPVERFWLCHLVACAVEERNGVSAMERLAATRQAG